MISISSPLLQRYVTVFGKLEDEDQHRLVILIEATDGKVQSGNKIISLDDALKLAEQDEYDSPQSKILRAEKAIRNWYLKPSQEAKQDLVERLKESKTSTILNRLNECLQVLFLHRVYELKTSFDQIYEGRDPFTKQKIDPITQSKALHAATETLISTGIPELEAYAIEQMSEYQTKLRKNLEETAQDKYSTPLDFYRAAAPLLASQAPHLLKFVKEQDKKAQAISKVSNAYQQASREA